MASHVRGAARHRRSTVIEHLPSAHRHDRDWTYDRHSPHKAESFSHTTFGRDASLVDENRRGIEISLLHQEMASAARERLITGVASC